MTNATTFEEAHTTAARVVRGSLQGRRVDWAGVLFQVLLLVGLAGCLAILVTLLWDIAADGVPVLAERGTGFLTSGLSRDPAEAGVWQGIFGSLLLAVVVMVIAFPLGIAAAIYLEEYASDNWFTRGITLTIRNLAGVPSVVYGILGLTIFVKLLGDSGRGGLTGGRSILTGGLTLAVLVLPLVIITASEAIRAVPQSLREGGFGIGATRWEVVRTLVLPNAAPGILTGLVLSISRAIGETAPLILIGAVGGAGFLSTGDAGFAEQLRGPFTALPMIVYGWAKLPSDQFRNELAPAAIIVLLAVTLLLNAAAIILRNRFERSW